MNEIEVISKIKREKLDERNYFNSLIESAYEEQMLSEDDIVNIQIQILQLLDEIVYKYNGLDSSSIRKEILEDISNSNNYTIGVYLKTFRNPDEAIKILENAKKYGEQHYTVANLIFLYNWKAGHYMAAQKNADSCSVWVCKLAGVFF